MYDKRKNRKLEPVMPMICFVDALSFFLDTCLRRIAPVPESGEEPLTYDHINYFHKRTILRPLQPDSADLDIADIALITCLVFLFLGQEKVLRAYAGFPKVQSRVTVHQGNTCANFRTLQRQTPPPSPPPPGRFFEDIFSYRDSAIPEQPSTFARLGRSPEIKIGDVVNSMKRAHEGASS